MRRFHAGFHAACRKGSAAAVLLPLLLLASSCSRGGEKSVLAPVPEQPRHVTQVAEMRWVWEHDALSGAVLAASRNPLVQRALVDAPVSGLVPRPDLAIRAVGADSDGAPIGFTILPYSVGGDRTRAAFVSVAQAFGREAVEFAELIVGREPRPEETGFERAVWGNQIVWVRTGDAYELVSRGGHLAPMKRNWGRFFSCLTERMPAGCAAGASIANDLAPAFPRAAAVGCAIGALGGAASCVLDMLGK